MDIGTPRHNRCIKDYDDNDLTGPNFVDHFSLREPSSTVRFRGARVHVYETTDEQIVIEDRVSSRDEFFGDVDDDDDDEGESGRLRNRRHSLTVKRVPFANFGLFLLRILYTLVSLLLFGYLFAFSFQTLLFVFIKLATEARQASDEYDPYMFVSVATTLLSAPMFLYGFSSLMALATTFVSEAWSGGNLFRAVIGFPSAVKETMYCVLLLLLPAMTLVGSLFARIDRVWEITCYAWVAGVIFMFALFAIAIVWVEVATCFRLLSIHFRNDEDDRDGTFLNELLRNALRSILIVQRQKYCGKQYEQYIVTGDDVSPDGGYTFSDKKPNQISKSIYTRIVELECLRFMFDKIPAKRMYSLEEVLDVMPFITQQTWSLEAMFCIRSRTRTILTAKGPSALKSSQIISSFTCSIIAAVTLILIFVGLLFWLETGLGTYMLVAVISIVFCLYPMIKTNAVVLQMYRDVNKDEIMVDYLKAGGDEAETQEKGDCEETEETIFFKLWETTVVAQPKNWLCYLTLALEQILLFWFPFLSLLSIRNYPVAFVFFIVAYFSLLRITFGASAIVSELGPLNKVQIERRPGMASRRRIFKRRATHIGEAKTLVKKARFAEIIGHISKRDATIYWMGLFGALLLAFFFLSILAVLSGDGFVERPPLILVGNYSYPSEDNLQYPSCSLSKGFYMKDKGNVLLDHSFMSIMAYEKPIVTDYILPQFFSDVDVVDETDLVKEYREEKGNSNIDIVSFIIRSNNASISIGSFYPSTTI